MPTELTRLLEVEEALRTVLARAEELSRRAAMHGDAAESLAQARVSLSDLAGTTGAVAAGALEAVTAIKSMSGPEVLERLAEFQASLDKALREIERQLAQSAEAVPHLLSTAQRELSEAARQTTAEQVEVLRREIREELLSRHEATTASIERAGSANAQAIKEMGARAGHSIKEAGASYAAAIKALDTKVDSLSQAVSSSHKRLLYATAACVAISSIVLVVMLVVR